jgi:hypothetical protein
MDAFVSRQEEQSEDTVPSARSSSTATPSNDAEPVESCSEPTESSVATLRVIHVTDVYTLANFPHLATLINAERE